MENSRPQRPRIVKRFSTLAITDPLEFKENSSTLHARLICNTTDQTESEVWFDKHYHIRYQHGDENGKRHGIEPQTVEYLVKKSIKYLLLYSSMIKGFKFVNYKGQSENPTRVVLKEKLNHDMLNVIIEGHYIGINKYEITVKTAMCAEDFRVESGQFVVEFQDDMPILKKWVNGKLEDICCI